MGRAPTEAPAEVWGSSCDSSGGRAEEKRPEKRCSGSGRAVKYVWPEKGRGDLAVAADSMLGRGIWKAEWCCWLAVEGRLVEIEDVGVLALDQGRLAEIPDAGVCIAGVTRADIEEFERIRPSLSRGGTPPSYPPCE